MSEGSRIRLVAAPAPRRGDAVAPWAMPRPVRDAAAGAPRARSVWLLGALAALALAIELALLVSIAWIQP